MNSVTATFKLNKPCKAVDKYDEIDPATERVFDKGTDKPLLGTIYVRKDVSLQARKIQVTVTTEF